jgi:hypothetical protein
VTSLHRDEFDRMWRVLDQNLTAHSVLRDRYRRLEWILTLVVILLSIVATAFALLSGDTPFRFGGLDLKLQSMLAVLTAAIFFLTLAEMIFRWHQKAWSHEYAVHRLAELKATMRSVTVTGELVNAGSDLQGAYERAMASVPEIPERQFLTLKARHHRKVALSKLIDQHKGAPLIYLRLLTLVQGIRGERPPAKPNLAEIESVEESPL